MPRQRSILSERRTRTAMLMTKIAAVESMLKRRIANTAKGGVATALTTRLGVAIQALMIVDGTIESHPIDIGLPVRRIANAAKRMMNVMRNHIPLVTRRNPNTAMMTKKNINHLKRIRSPTKSPNTKNHSKTKLPKLMQQN